VQGLGFRVRVQCQRHGPCTEAVCVAALAAAVRRAAVDRD